MSKAVRTTLSLVISLVLFSAAALAHAGGNNADKDKNKNKERPSRISKLAFWRHYKDNHKSAKTDQAKQAQPKQAQVKAVQTKPAPATLAAGKKGQKQEHARSKARANKASGATKTKPQEKTRDRTTASLKQ